MVDMSDDMAFGRSGRPRRPARRPWPQAARRLRREFPDLWAWYEMLAAVRGRDASPRPGMRMGGMRRRSGGLL